MTELIRGRGTFIKRSEYIFRMQAELTFGEGTGKRIIAIGLNPGSCQLSDRNLWNKLLISENQTVTGDIRPDRTMLHIRDIVLEASPNFHGKVVIYNMLNYRNGNLNEALACYKDLKNKGDHLEELETDFQTLLKGETASFVWLGWSLTRTSVLNKRKQQVLDTISGLQRQVVAKFHEDNPLSPHVGHFCPQLKRDADIYRSYIVPQLKRLLDMV